MWVRSGSCSPDAVAFLTIVPPIWLLYRYGCSPADVVLTWWLFHQHGWSARPGCSSGHSWCADIVAPIRCSTDAFAPPIRLLRRYGRSVEVGRPSINSLFHQYGRSIPSVALIRLLHQYNRSINTVNPSIRPFNRYGRFAGVGCSSTLCSNDTVGPPAGMGCTC